MSSILPKIKEPQETTLIMSVQYKDSTKEAEPQVFSMSKSRTIDHLKNKFAFPGIFWASLNKRNEATTDDNGKIITFRFE